jgi:hypothetical protein
LCIATFRGAIAESLADEGAFLHCIAQLIQLFIRSFYGQQLFDSSSKIAEAIYDSGWEKITDLRIKNDLQMVLIRAQRPSKLTTIKFSTLSLVQFMNVSEFPEWIIVYLIFHSQITFSTYSHYTFIQQVYSKSKN